MTQEQELLKTYVAANPKVEDATTEVFKRQQRVQWFTCNNLVFVKENLLVLRRSFDDRETDLKAKIYHNYSLLQYACVFDRVDILDVIYPYENDFVTEEAVELLKNNTTIAVPKGSTALMLAISCNSNRCVSYLLKDLTLTDVKIPLNEKFESAVMVAARLPGYLAAEIALSHPILQQKEFHYETDKSENIVKIALKNNNAFLTHLFTELLATPRADCIQKFALKNASGFQKPECEQHLRILKESALARVAAERLYEQAEWLVILEKEYSEKVVIFKKQYEDMQEKKKKAIEYRSTPDAVIKQTKQQFTINRKPTYDFEAKKAPTMKKFKLQMPKVDVKELEEPEEIPEPPPRVKPEEKQNLFDGALENAIPVLISQYSNTFQPSRPEQLAAARNFAQDDRVVQISQAQINWFDVCRDGNLNLCKSMIRTHANEIDTRPTDPEKLIFNGFSGIHYATVFGRWQVVQYLMTFEALNVTKARVILKTPGIAADRAVVVPLQSNALQLACYCNQTQIIKMIIDSLITPRKELVDPIQSSFSKNVPLTQEKQKQILTLKNELEQTALAVLAQCKVTSHDLCKDLDRQDYIIQLTLDQLNSKNILDFNDQYVILNAYLFNNVHVMKTLRTELLTNPCSRLPRQKYAQLLFKVYDMVKDIQNQVECKDILANLQIAEEVKCELILVERLIAAQYYVNCKEEDEDAKKEENQHQEHLPEAERFRKYFKATFVKYEKDLQDTNLVETNLRELQYPQYVDKFEYGTFSCREKALLTRQPQDLEYLSSVVQKQDLSYFFDVVILGSEKLVKENYRQFARKVDNRQTGKGIINGFTALLYACYYGHIGIVKMLLNEEFDVISFPNPETLKQGESTDSQIMVEVSKAQCYIFKKNITCYQAAILSKSPNQKQIIDYITQMASENPQIAAHLFNNYKQSSDLLKLSIISKQYYILKNPLIRRYETSHIYMQLKQYPQTPTILYTICEYQSIEGIKFLQDIILADSITARLEESDLCKEVKVQIESELLFSLQLCCLQRIDGKSPLDLIQRQIKETKKMTEKDYIALQVAIKFVNDLANDAIMRALTMKDDDVTEALLNQYYGTTLDESKKQYEAQGRRYSGEIVQLITTDHENGHKQLQQTNFFVEDHLINRLSFEPIQKLNEVDVWFEMCKYGTLQQVQSLAKDYISRRELRYNNYDLNIHQGFTGLMYAILCNSLEVVLFLMDFEGMMHLEQEALVKSRTGPFYLPKGASPLHLASVVAEQYVIDAFFQFYRERKYEIVDPISVTRFLIIHDKRCDQEQLRKDFIVDHQLLRLAVQYSRKEFLAYMSEFMRDLDYLEEFSNQLFNKFSFKDLVMTMRDLIWLLPSQTYAKLNPNDVKETIIFVEDAIKTVLWIMHEKGTLNEHTEIIMQFFGFDSPEIIASIDTSFKILKQPKVVHDEKMQGVKENQYRIRDETVEINVEEKVMDLIMQKPLQNDWFRACRENDMAFIHKFFKQMKTLRDDRQSSFINQVHAGFCGIHYALIYQAEDVFSFLFDFEWNCLVGCDNIINGDQGRYYVPAESTILHLIALVRNDKYIRQMRLKPQIEQLINVVNIQKTSPIELISGQNYCDSYFFNMFVINFSDSEMRSQAEAVIEQSFRNCCYSDNLEFGRLCKQNYDNYQPLIFKHIFTLWDKRQAGNELNKSELIFMELKDEALEYALFHRMDNMWKNILERHFGEEVKDVEEEYHSLKKYQSEQFELVEEEDVIYKEPNVIIFESRAKINEPKQMKYLRESKQTDEQKRWFSACKGGNKEDIEFVRKHSHLAGLQDESLTNYKTKTYTQFTGLMYAIVFGNLDVVKLLLKSELLIYSSAKNLVEIPDDFASTRSEDEKISKTYYLFRQCYSIMLAVVCHQYKIFDYFIQELKTQEELIYSPLIYETMVSVDYQIPYSYMIKLMSTTNFNLLKIAFVMHKDSHMKYLIEFLTSDMEYASTKKRDTADRKVISVCKLDQIIYKQYLSLLNCQPARDAEKSTLDTWMELGENAIALMEMAKEFGLNTAYDSEIMGYLINIYGEFTEYQEENGTLVRRSDKLGAHDMVKEHHRKKFLSDKIVPEQMEEVIHNSFVVTDESYIILKKEVEPEDEEKKLLKQLKANYFDAVKDNDIPAVKKQLLEFVMKPEERVLDLQNQIYPGFCAIHYAAFMNNTPMIGILWNHEKYAVTTEDVVIDSLGCGYGNKFLVSQGSNALQIAVLQDNQESVQMILGLVQNDLYLSEFYQRKNKRGLNNLYIACLCWRCNAGKLLFQSKMIQTQLKQIAIHNDPEMVRTLDIIVYTNSSFLARILYEWSQTDLQFKNGFYSVILQNDFTIVQHTHDKQTYGSEAEKKLIKTWLDLVYEDALNCGLKQMADINWNRQVTANLKGLTDIIQKQYAINRQIIVTDGRIELFDDLLMQQTIVKQKDIELQNKIRKARADQDFKAETFNTLTQGKFNTDLNVTSLENVSENRYELPQQQVLKQPQVILKTPPKVLGAQKAESNEKMKNMMGLWTDIDEGK